MNKKKFYITTTLPYVNADPHIGFAAEIVRADTIARFKRLLGYEVFFNTGTDEHGLKIHRKAESEGIDTQEYVDKYAKRFDDLKLSLNLSYNNFIRTTDKNHKEAAQEFWKLCEKNGDIYKKNYKINYCVGCELELTDSELVDGKCPHHPGQELEVIEEENYFFKWSNYADRLLEFYGNNPAFVVPDHRYNEIKKFIEMGLKDFSISRLKTKMPWGVPVPGDEDHVMYVWFDALTNYINCLGWNKKDKKFEEFWPGMQVAGKDNLRQQTAMWQAMLMSAGFKNSTKVLIFGFITADGQKMSKSVGNVVNPLSLTEKYGTDAVRYYLLGELQPFEDSDYTEEKFALRYQADLVNGLGNLVSRTSNMLEKNSIEFDFEENTDEQLLNEVKSEMDKYRFDDALKVLWKRLTEMDEFLSETAPWKIENYEKKKEILLKVGKNIVNVAYILQAFLPETAGKILSQFKEKQVKKGEILFPRI